MMNLLLIEDNQCDAMLIRRQLTKWLGDFHCVEIERLQQLHGQSLGDFDIVITDAHLPDADLPDIVAIFKTGKLNCPYIVTSGEVDSLSVSDLALPCHALVLKGEWQQLNNALLSLQLIN